MSWAIWLSAGVVLGVLAGRWYEIVRVRVIQVRAAQAMNRVAFVPTSEAETLRPAPVRATPATMVWGTTETYSHPEAMKHLAGAVWSPGGMA